MNPRLNPIATAALATLLCAAVPRLLASESLATRMRRVRQARRPRETLPVHWPHR